MTVPEAASRGSQRVRSWKRRTRGERKGGHGWRTWMWPHELQKRVSAHRAGRLAELHCQHFVSLSITTLQVVSHGVQSLLPATALGLDVEHGEHMNRFACIRGDLTRACCKVTECRDRAAVAWRRPFASADGLANLIQANVGGAIAFPADRLAASILTVPETGGRLSRGLADFRRRPARSRIAVDLVEGRDRAYCSKSWGDATRGEFAAGGGQAKHAWHATAAGGCSSGGGTTAARISSPALSPASCAAAGDASCCTSRDDADASRDDATGGRGGYAAGHAAISTITGAYEAAAAAELSSHI